MNEYAGEWRPLVVDELSTPSELSLHDLKKAVIRTRYLITNWKSDCPIVTYISPTLTVSLERALATNIRGGGPHFISRNHMLVAHNDGNLACFRLDTGACISTSEPSRSSLPFIFPHSKSSSAYIVATEHFGDSLKLSTRNLKLRIPSATDKSSEVEFELVQELVLPPTWVVLRLNADIDRRRICVLFLLPWPASNTLKILVVLDWDDNSCALLDSGLNYISNYTGVSAQFTNDGKGLIVAFYSQDFHWQHYEIAKLQKRTFSVDACFDTSIHSLLPSRPGLHGPMPDIYVDGFTLLHVWNPLTAQSWRDCAGLPSFSSFVYLLCADDPGDNFMNFEYRVVQYYAREDVPSGDYFLADLTNCATLAGDVFPMIDVSFSHLCWVLERWDGHGTFKRKLMLASFLPPFMDLSSRSLRCMEVPDAILENAARIFLVPSEGSIMIQTTGRKLYTFRYA